MRHAIGFAAIAVLLLTESAQSATLRNVPADFTTIQAAINASADQDTVLVAPGTYTENLDFGAKTIHVLSSGGAELTTLQPALPSTTFVSFAGGGPETEFAGFTLDGGDMQHAIRITGGSPRIHHNVIRNHVSYAANATEIGSYSGTPVISFCLFVHNRSIGGVGIFGGGGQILSNTFHDCSRGFWSQGVGVIAKNNIVTNSVQFGVADDGFAVSDYNCVFNNNPNYDYGAVPGPNDFSEYPEYCDSSLDNYGLDLISPCIASGEGGSTVGAFGIACGNDAGPRVLALSLSGASPTHVIDHTPDIVWTYFDIDNLPQAESEIEVGWDDDWAVAEMWDPPTFPGNATTHTYEGAELFNGGTYWLRVRVNNGVEWGEWSVRTFRMNTPPSQPGLSFPDEGSILGTDSPVLYVNTGGDIQHDPLTFEYEVYADAALTMLVANASGQPEAWTVFPPLTLENQTHWWRARASDSYEESPWSEVRSFILDAVNSPPVAGALIAPVDGGPVPATTVQFDWTEASDSDPSQNPISQTLHIATDSQFVFSTQWVDLPQSEFAFGGLYVSQRYWWKIRFIDSEGLWTETPAAQFFIPGPGDMNMNRTINLVDVILAIDVIFRGVPAPAAFYLTDVNGDCSHDIQDIVVLINHAFRGGPVPLSVCNVSPHILRVPSQFPTIFNAMTVAVDDDTIVVEPGLYRENIDFGGKRVHLLGENGPSVTTLEPFVSNQPTLRFASGEPWGAGVSGFTIQGGDSKHVVQIANNASPSIHHNVIRDHISYVYNATAIGSYNSSPLIEFNLFYHTRSLGGIGIFSGGGTIQNNTFDDNSRGYWSQGIGVIARNNIVTNSTDFGIGDDGFAVNDYNCTYNNNSEYCCGAVPGPNDFTADPLYCNPGSLNYNLAPGSLCILSGYGGVNRGAFPAGCLVR